MEAQRRSAEEESRANEAVRQVQSQAEGFEQEKALLRKRHVDELKARERLGLACSVVQLVLIHQCPDTLDWELCLCVCLWLIAAYASTYNKKCWSS